MQTSNVCVTRRRRHKVSRSVWTDPEAGRCLGNSNLSTPLVATMHAIKVELWLQCFPTAEITINSPNCVWGTSFFHVIFQNMMKIGIILKSKSFVFVMVTILNQMDIHRIMLSANTRLHVCDVIFCDIFSVAHKFSKIVTKFWIHIKRTDISHRCPADANELVSVKYSWASSGV